MDVSKRLIVRGIGVGVVREGHGKEKVGEYCGVLDKEGGKLDRRGGREEGGRGEGGEGLEREGGEKYEKVEETPRAPTSS
ncbi:hypothetical protein KGM_202545 [Danaus plexippus plexippus]|uniref:Uncharacterized protein n=1 Tax=Danaus plexippus plexippus TaxID=278856 RepID=A0A212FPB7_DANPL|nr:hypothetical protein KGM_202545 [Danaus plexippus plexippus]